MFSSNQKLNISGDLVCKEQITKALELIMFGYGFKPRYYYTDVSGCIHLTSSLPNVDYSVNEIVDEDCKLEYIISLVELHFNSSKFLSGLAYASKCGGDGSNHKGWEMEINKIENEVIIKPYWAFYHK